MKRLLLAHIIFILLPMNLLGQQNITGFVRDSADHEALIGAYIYDSSGKNGTSTDNNGYFSFRIDPGEEFLYISYVGYRKKKLSTHIIKEEIVNIYLENSSELDEVEILAKRNKNINVSNLSRMEFISIPSLGAEADIMKTLHLLPGIQAPNEGSSDLIIRGGGPGENLFLLDNIPLNYVNHLGGFFSVFNPEIINNVAVYKGGFPAKYGGKISSVVDITLREGNPSKIRGAAGIGVTGANIAIDGPMCSNSSFVLTARKTFTELLLGTASYFADQNAIISYGFYDINGKLTWKPDNHNHFHASLYTGDDQMFAFTVNDPNKKFLQQNLWGNVLGAMKWKHIFNSKLFVSNSIALSRYRVRNSSDFTILNPDSTLYDYEKISISSIRDLSLKSDWKISVNKNYNLDFGIQLSQINYLPNRSWDSKAEKNENKEIVPTLDASLYVENIVKLGNIFKSNLGFRFVNYNAENYSDFHIEPRINLTLLPNHSHSLQLSYMKAFQHSFMLTTAGSFINNQVWIPVISGMLPSNSDQYTFGLNGGLVDNMLSYEIVVYYKDMRELKEFKLGYASLPGDQDWASKIETGGRGLSKGIEVMLRKSQGNWNGFFSYAYANTIRQFTEINFGNSYVYDFDRPHTVSVSINYKFNDRLDFNALWIYQTGLPYTPAIGQQEIPDIIGRSVTSALVFGERNSARISNYHRLDVGMNYKVKTKKGRNAIWTFSIYNVYNRKNAYNYFYSSGSNYLSTYDESITLFKYSFFPLIPSVSYKFDF